MVVTVRKYLEICRSRLSENKFTSTRTAKNVPLKFVNNDKHFDKSDDVVLTLHRNQKQT